MNFPMAITFRGMPATEAITSYVERRAARLDRYAPKLMSCRAALEAPQGHRGHHRVAIEMSVKGRELVVSRDPADCHAREDLYAAIDDAFDDAIRMLDSHFARTRANRRAASVRERAYAE